MAKKNSRVAVFKTCVVLANGFPPTIATTGNTFDTAFNLTKCPKPIPNSERRKTATQLVSQFICRHEFFNLKTSQIVQSYQGFPPKTHGPWISPNHQTGLHFVPHRPRHQLQLDPTAGASHPGGKVPKLEGFKGFREPPNGLGSHPKDPITPNPGGFGNCISHKQMAILPSWGDDWFWKKVTGSRNSLWKMAIFGIDSLDFLGS